MAIHTSNPMKNINVTVTLITLFTALFGITPSATAADWNTSGGLVITHQSTNTPFIENEMAASADLVASRHTDTGTWLAHVEGATTPTAQGVSGMLPEANSDVGSALNVNNEGRIQLSELYYHHEFSPSQVITAGLLDVSGFFEQSRIASDETTKFLGVSFTGNPSIEFPDYSLGLVYKHSLKEGPVLRAALASSHGISDNPKRSYSQLLSVKDDDKGIFAIASASWKNNSWLLRVGTWVNTENHNALNGSSNALNNYGSYLLTGYRLDRHAFNMRLGLANEKVSQASGFASLSYQFQQGDYVMGAGIARAFLSAKEPNTALNDTTHYEVYLRYDITQAIFLTGDIQHIVNSDFGILNENRGVGVTVYGLRLSYLVESVFRAYESLWLF